jgi:DNA-binding response OmpR family regulator
MSQPAETLSGQRVLIVEDRYLIAAEMADEVGKLGGEVIGPARDIEGASQVVASEPLDLALLDVNLDGEPVFPVAQALSAKGVPFIFLTGYDRDVLPPEWRDRPRLAKPVNGRMLREELLKLSARRRKDPPDGGA